MTVLPGPSAPLYSEEIDRRWRSVLMSFFLRRVHDRSEAEDLTQETFARTVQRVSHTESTNIRSYLFTIGANLLRDRARRAVTHELKAHDSLSNPKFNLNVFAAENQGAERVLIARETLREALNALSELDVRTRDIFILFRMEKMRHREIAALYGISVSAVEKQVVKAVTHLAMRLGDND